MNVGDPPEQPNNGTSTGGGTPCESPVQTVRLNLSANEAHRRRLDENYVTTMLRTHQQLWMGPIPYPSPATSSVSSPLVPRHEATELISDVGSPLNHRRPLSMFNTTVNGSPIPEEIPTTGNDSELLRNYTYKHVYESNANQLANLDDSRVAETCPLCFMVYHDGELVRRLGCFHLFHTACVDDFLNKSGTCPTCRTEIDSGEA